MRHVAFLCGIFLILAFTAGAQVNSGPSLLLGSPMPALELATPTPAAAPVPGADPLALGAPPEPEPQGVYGVIQNYNWQAYVGFTHFVFFFLPGVFGTLTGFNMYLSSYSLSR